MKPSRTKKLNLSGNNHLALAKNLLRPYMSARRRDFSNNLQRLRAGYPLSELPDLLRFMEGNPALPFEGFGNVVPRDPKRVPDSRYSRLETLSLQRELDLSIARLNFHAETLLAQLEALKGINDTLLGHCPGDALEACERFHPTYGHSLIIAKKQLLASFLQGNIRGLATTFSSLTARADGWAWSLLMKYYYDLSDPSYDIDQIMISWRSFLDHPKIENTFVYRPLQMEVFGSVENETQLATTIHHYNPTSLLDLLLVIWRQSALGEQPELRAAVDNTLDARLSAFLAINFRFKNLAIPLRYREASDRMHDLDVLRMSIFFDEYSNIAQWRASITRLFIGYDRSNSIFPELDHSELKEASRNLASNFDGLEQSWTHSARYAREAVLDDGSSINTDFSNMLIAADFLRHCEDPGSLNERSLANLIASAHGLSDVLANSQLKRIGSSLEQSGHFLAAFMIAEMIFRSIRTPDNDLERRAQFMDLIQGQSTSIISFIQDAQSWSEPTAVFLARLCTRSFIERLYMIVSSVKDVIEARIAVVDWLVENDREYTVNYTEEAETLRSELANLDVRTDLDSTRVHVDEDALGDWFGATQRALITRYAQTVLAEGADPKRESILSFYNRLRDEGENSSDRAFLLESQIGSDFLLLQIVENTLKTFVSDRLFGLDAYLSRRIRHGTLSGFLLTPLTRLITPGMDTNDDMAEVHPDAADANLALRDWLDELTGALDAARREILQVKSEKKPNGLIDATWRTGTGVTLLDATFSKIRPKVFETSGKYDFFPDVYALCWDLIERDLASIRRFLNNQFYKDFQTRLQCRYNELGPEARAVAYHTFNRVGGALRSRIQHVSAWFIRPVFRKEIYSLRTLVESTLSIIREFEPNAAFCEVIAVPDDELISRGAFEMIGDTLFILLGNAVKHGSPEGEISVSSVKSDEQSVTIAVRSHVPTQQDLERAIDRISDAMGSGREDIASASVGEGFSGIRKVLGDLSRVQGGKVNMDFYIDEETNAVEFEFTLPRRIILAKV